MGDCAPGMIIARPVSGNTKAVGTEADPRQMDKD